MNDRPEPVSDLRTDGRLWIKICGLTTRSDVRAALDAGADAIGFVFAPSSRQVSPGQAARLAGETSGAVMRVAVMLHPSQALLDEVWSRFRPDLLQTDLEDLGGLQLPDDLGVLPVVRSNRAPPAPLPRSLLYEGARSGTGECTDWASAARVSRATRLVLAGGLNPDNVAAAITAVRPFGVDVSSGVEMAPGIKDALKIHAFVRRARAAESGVGG
ncbi:phosphoribosylanthranilate isomerase [Steroidobacter denitrificans]|uniref:N-(5'-phosphoribosyl)anthranilate isomerase n=1 Tax=Steroidobacter denitrificans TaxID=465721 RepID=A0A127FD89_STEDE|nr:phosphoribosylanthranilate isomerase [Steroidobacter denitrificans]AMN48354.1 phosphoribosylanthranilate isomerase [Steroidobacter denitrificans]